MDTYFWIVCPDFLPIRLLVGYMYISVTTNSDAESQGLNFEVPEDSQICCTYMWNVPNVDILYMTIVSLLLFVCGTEVVKM